MLTSSTKIVYKVFVSIKAINSDRNNVTLSLSAHNSSKQADLLSVFARRRAREGYTDLVQHFENFCKPSSEVIFILFCTWTFSAPLAVNKLRALPAFTSPSRRCARHVRPLRVQWCLRGARWLRYLRGCGDFAGSEGQRHVTSGRCGPGEWASASRSLARFSAEEIECWVSSRRRSLENDFVLKTDRATYCPCPCHGFELPLALSTALC